MARVFVVATVGSHDNSADMGRRGGNTFLKVFENLFFSDPMFTSTGLWKEAVWWVCLHFCIAAVEKSNAVPWPQEYEGKFFFFFFFF